MAPFDKLNHLHGIVSDKDTRVYTEKNLRNIAKFRRVYKLAQNIDQSLGCNATIKRKVKRTTINIIVKV